MKCVRECFVDFLFFRSIKQIPKKRIKTMVIKSTWDDFKTSGSMSLRTRAFPSAVYTWFSNLNRMRLDRDEASNHLKAKLSGPNGFEGGNVYQRLFRFLEYCPVTLLQPRSSNPLDSWYSRCKTHLALIRGRGIPAQASFLRHFICPGRLPIRSCSPLSRRAST